MDSIWLEQLPPRIRASLINYPPRIRAVYVRDAIQQVRFAGMSCLPSLLADLSRKELDLFQAQFSRFLIYSAYEWYLSIPRIQWSSYWLQMTLRECLIELIAKGEIKVTEGWGSLVVQSCLLYWCTSPNVGSKAQKLYFPDEVPGCPYCEARMGCMASGVHLCKTHGELYLTPRPDMFSTILTLKDSRVIYSLARAQWADENSIELELEQPRKTLKVEWGQEWDHITSSPIIPPVRDQDLLDMRDRLIQDRRTRHPQTFWDT